MSYVIQIVSRANGQKAKEFEGKFIQDFNVEEGLTVTPFSSEARKFPTQATAHEFWTQELPQGEWGHNFEGPNRPLTAYNVWVLEEDDA